MPSFVRFEDVTDWSWAEVSERSFRERHEPRLIQFKRGCERLAKNLSRNRRDSEHSADQLDQIKANLEQLKSNRDHLKEQIDTIVQKLPTVEADNKYLTGSNSDADKKLKEFESEKDKLEKELDLFKKEVRDRYKAFVLAKNVYKNKLNIHIGLEGLADGDEKVTLKLFNSMKTSNGLNTIVFIKSKDNQYRLVSTNPELPVFDILAKKFKETGDIPGLVCCIRKCFLLYYANNKK